MRVNVKTLKGILLEIDIEEEKKAEDLKLLIQAKRSDFSADKLKLIYDKKVLRDEHTLAQIGVKEGEVIFLMVSRSPVTQNNDTDDTTNNKIDANSAASAIVPERSEADKAMEAESASDPPAVNDLVSKGFPRSEARRAFKDVGENVKLAEEIIFAGIPMAARRRAEKLHPDIFLEPHLPPPTTEGPSEGAKALAETLWKLHPYDRQKFAKTVEMSEEDLKNFIDRLYVPPEDYGQEADVQEAHVQEAYATQEAHVQKADVQETNTEL